MQKTRLLIAALFLILPFAANATLIEMELGDLLIGDSVYNVVLFQDDSGTTTLDDVFGSSVSPFFTSAEDATTAAQAIFDYGVAQSIDLSPFSSLNAALVPFNVNANTYSFVVAYISQGGLTGPFLDYSRGSRSGGSFATFTAVPEPGTLALLGIGLAALGLSRRRRAA